MNLVTEVLMRGRKKEKSRDLVRKEPFPWLRREEERLQKGAPEEGAAQEMLGWLTLLLALVGEADWLGNGLCG